MRSRSEGVQAKKQRMKEEKKVITRKKCAFTKIPCIQICNLVWTEEDKI